MAFQFSNSSLTVLSTVHSDLQKIARRAIALSPVDFSVVQGARTIDQQMRLFGKGRTSAECAARGVPIEYAVPSVKQVTWTLHSNHIGGHAIDVCPFIDGAIAWDDSGSLGLWPKIAAAFKQAATETGVTIYWGGDWASRKDRPHFSLVNG